MRPQSEALAERLLLSRPHRWALSNRAWRLLVAGASVLFAIGWTLFHGKALHWDAVNYHFYLGFAALHDRFSTDFFAAGTPSYINPYAYVPLYLMTSGGLPDFVVAVVLATSHGLIFWLTYELALLGMPRSATSQRQVFAVLAAVLAAMSPVLLQGLGLTLVDIPLGVFVLGSWLALAMATRRSTYGWIALGALLGGLATGLKLSNAPYALAALSLVAFFPGDWKRKMRAATVYGIISGLGFLIVGAPWGWKLWSTFGNPLFPLLNDVFRSPDFTTATLYYERFRPTTLIEFLARPFELLSTLSRQNTEGRAPDLRFAVLFVLLAGGLAFSWSRQRRPECSEGQVDPDARRVLRGLVVAFLIAWCLWLKTSGNSRYFIPMGCVAAALLALLLQRAYMRWKDATLTGIALILLAQGVQIVIGSDWKRDGVAWGGPVLEMQFPERFVLEPHFFLSTSFLSGSAFLPFWHRDTGMMTTSGFYTIGPDHPGGKRAQELIAKNAGRLRSLARLPKGYDETTGLPGPASALDIYVRRFGLAIDPTDCEFVKLRSNILDNPAANEQERWSNWVSCRVREEPENAKRYASEVREVDVIFDRIEATCPNLFHPPKPVTEQYPNWTRLYNMGSEMQLWISEGRVLYRSPLRGGDPIDAGSAAEWAKGAQPIDCSRRFMPAFGMKE